jgi:tetratricopeptide (TPR) repeat protein
MLAPKLIMRVMKNNMTPNMFTTRTILTVAAVAATYLATAQNANVVNAYNYMRNGELAKAAEYIDMAIQDPKTGVAEKTWRYRGDIYRLILENEDAAIQAQFPDAMDRAVESYIKATELDTKNSYRTENIRALGSLQGRALNDGNDAFTGKNYDQAIAMYGQSERIAKAFGQVDTNAVFNSALAYESKGDSENAIRRYREAIEIGYNKPEVYRYIASLQRRNNDLDAAIATAREGRQRFPDDKDLILDEMSFLLAADRSDEAEETVKLALQKDPNNAILYSVQGSLFDGKANPKEGPAPEEAEMLKWYEEAERAYKKSIELDPKFFDAYFNVGVLYNNRAAFEYEKCNSIKADAEYMKCKKGADEIYLKAVPYFEKAHELRPDDNQTIQQLMKLYAKTNDQERYQVMKNKLSAAN